jgi:hypothetical protein
MFRPTPPPQLLRRHPPPPFGERRAAKELAALPTNAPEFVSWILRTSEASPLFVPVDPASVAALK